MSLPTIRKQLAALQAQLAARRQGPDDRVEALRADPARILAAAGMPPDPWQRQLLCADWSRALLCCSRQVGKSQTAAALALKAALLQPASLVLILSPTLRQSGELFRAKLLPIWRRLGCPLMDTRPTQLALTLANESRIISLPENEEGIRGYSGVSLLIIDEAARVGDGLYYAVRPMLSTSGGRLIAMSSPFGRRGFFYEAWTGGDRWTRVSIRADQCPRIPAAFLAEEKAALGARWFRQEYCCSFEDTVGAVFSAEDIEAAFSDQSITPMFEQPQVAPKPTPDVIVDGDSSIEPLFGSGGIV